MPLKQTKILLEQYGKKLIDGTINNEDLVELMRTKFSKSPGYVDPEKTVTETNHSQKDSIDDFVLAIAPQLQPEILHELTKRMIDLAPNYGPNTFMRNSTLEKAFLAYEMVLFPDSAAMHFQLKRMKDEFDDKAVKNLKSVILEPIQKLYQQRIQILELKKYYAYGTNEEKAGRFHLYSVKAEDFAKLSPELQKLKGDCLKSKILTAIKQDIRNVNSLDKLSELVEAFKQSSEYQVLSTGQGLFTRFFHIQTSSIKAFHMMVHEREQEIAAANLLTLK